MAIQVFGAPAAVIMLNRAFADTSPGNLIYQNQVAAATANQTAFANDFGAGYASLSDAALAERVLGNLGLLPNAALQTALADYYAANGAANRGFVTLQLCNILASKEGDATYGAAAVAWNSEVATGFNYSANTANTSESSSSSASTGQTFTLTTNVDAVSGGAADDTISGLIGSSGTYTVGDNINGGGGSDTLNLIATTGTATDVVSLDAVENVNVRLLDAADTTDVNAADWSGVAVLSNASSVADSTLRVSGLTLGTQIKVHGQTFVNVDFAGLTSATDTASLVLVNAGSGGGTAVSLSTANTADVTLDTTGSELLDAINVEVQGANYARIEGGDGLRTITLTGTGTAVINTDDLITSFNASALTGTNRFTFSGRSDVEVVGGAGNDTFAFGTSLNSLDTINGGSGTDSITATLGNSSVRVNSTGVESATITLAEAAGGGIDLSAAQAITTVTVAATAGASGTISNFVGGTVNASDTDITDLSIDTISGAALTLVVGSGTGGVVDISTASITDATSVVVTTVGSGTQAVNALAIDSDARTVTITSQGSASLTVATGYASAITALNITAAASAAISLTSADLLIGGTALATVNIAARDSNAADVTINGDMFSAGSAVSISRTINVDASSGADINLSSIQMGTSTMASGVAASGTLAGAGLVINASAGNGSDITWSAADNVDGLSATYNLNAAQSGDITLIGIGADITNASASAETSIYVSASAAQDANIALGTISGSGQTVSIGALSVGASGGFGITGGIIATAGDVVIGAITLGSEATYTAGGISASGVFVGGLNATLGASAGLVFGQLHATGSLGAISLTMGASSTATFGTILASANVGAITVVGGSDSSATFGNISAESGKIGDITLTLAATGTVDFGTIGSASAAGNITVTISSEGSADFGNILVTGGTLGDITLNVAGSASVDFANIGVGTAGTAGRVGTIAVSGSGWVDFGVVTAQIVAGIDLRNQGSGGSFTIDLSGVTNGVTVDGGRGTTSIISGKGNDEFFLKTGLGTDSITYNATAQATDSIYRLDATGDRIYLSVTAIDMADGVSGFANSAAFAGAGTANAVAVTFLNMSAESVTAMAGNDGLIITHTAFASTGAMLAYVGSGGSADITFSSANNASILIVWTDGTDSYVTLASATATETNLDDDTVTTTLASLVGVDLRASAFVTASFYTISV